ncbi:hypothetical protein EJ04DRAFT_60399 [Polyplosphaeria fusca]|uniref:Uncharacterized protein n=1 Tax=Polyplosphaeria fusca TaxID=682080 RepID=A0A9P4R7H8_9PLEO|nr:hypothetical protein EJ04DRAFT_60399 [Polyplosphaeria fusca]
MASSEVSWQSAFWTIPPLAINAMMQPSGRVCSYDPTLRTYLRSSPIVCAFDTLCILIRYVLYISHLRSPYLAAKRLMGVRRKDLAAAEHGGLQQLETSGFLRCFLFVFGVLPQTIKLVACKGLPWTQAWGLFYLSAFIMVEMMDMLARFTNDDIDISEGNPLETSDEWLAFFDLGCGAIAIFLQLLVLAWVDLAGTPPDPILSRRWEFRLIRLSAHFVVVFIYLPFIVSGDDDPVRALRRRNRSLLLSTLLIFIVLTILHGLNYRFSQMYFLWSIILTMLAWSLHSFAVMRKHFLLCGEEGSGTKNVLVFDFFCRILAFSLFWYVQYYKPEGTLKPAWADYLG